MLDCIDSALNAAQFDKLRSLMYAISGVVLQPGKEGLVQSRLTKRLRELRLANFDAYLDYLEGDAGREELLSMTDRLTTNKTFFFREKPHFDLLSETILPDLRRAGSDKLRVWCAGCSSGEEPYSIAMHLKASLPDLERWDIRILATDISPSMLALAREGLYDGPALQETSREMVARYFTREEAGGQTRFRIKPEVASPIHFSHLNLMSSWPMRGPFDVIFCRNVMIYFNQATRQNLVKRFWELLAPGGYLLVGHSESLTSQGRGDFEYIQPATYRK